jgi:hypothetical protein
MTTGDSDDLSDDPDPAAKAKAFDVRAWAADRSHHHTKISYDTAKASAQAAILINGGAATALFALFSKESHVSLRL